MPTKFHPGTVLILPSGRWLTSSEASARGRLEVRDIVPDHQPPSARGHAISTISGKDPVACALPSHYLALSLPHYLPPTYGLAHKLALSHTLSLVTHAHYDSSVKRDDSTRLSTACAADLFWFVGTWWTIRSWIRGRVCVCASVDSRSSQPEQH